MSRGGTSERFLAWVDRRLKRFLLAHVDAMPLSFSKTLAWYWPNAHVRRAYLRRFGVEMGEGTLANVGLIPVSGGSGRAHIGCHVSIAPNVTLILSSGANNGDRLNRYRYVAEKLTKSDDIIIRDEAWIGANVTILPGVTIGYCVVVGAGAVVTRDCEDYGIYAGVPARKIGDVRKLGTDPEPVSCDCGKM